jgi:hypothetical protein
MILSYLKLSHRSGRSYLRYSHILIFLTMAGMVRFLGAEEPVSWEVLFNRRLESNLSYREAEMQLVQAQQRANANQNFFIPQVTLGTSGQSGVSMRNGQLLPVAFMSEVRFSGILGADLVLSLPVTISPDTGTQLGDPSAVLSRRLFVEPQVTDLETRATLLRAEDSLIQNREDIKIALLEEILSAYYSLSLLEANRQNLSVLQRLIEVTPADPARREIERRILQARRSILRAESSLGNLDPVIRENIDLLYEQVRLLGEEWRTSLPMRGTIPGITQAILARELELQAAVQKKNFWFLPYLPNPNFSAGIYYNQNQGNLDWMVGMQFSLTILDRGERDLQAYQRRETATLAQIRLDAAHKSQEQSVRTAWDNLDILALDRALKALDVADEEDNVVLQRALVDRGFATQESLVTAEIDLSVEHLELLKIEHDLLVQELRLLRFFGTGRFDEYRY